MPTIFFPQFKFLYCYFAWSPPRKGGFGGIVYFSRRLFWDQWQWWQLEQLKGLGWGPAGPVEGILFV